MKTEDQSAFRFEPPAVPDTLCILEPYGSGDPRFVRVKSPKFGEVETVTFEGRVFRRTGERSAAGWPVFKGEGQ